MYLLATLMFLRFPVLTFLQGISAAKKYSDGFNLSGGYPHSRSFASLYNVNCNLLIICCALYFVNKSKKDITCQVSEEITTEKAILNKFRV